MRAATASSSLRTVASPARPEAVNEHEVQGEKGVVGDEPPHKRRKTGEAPELTPEQKALIARKRAQALAKLEARKQQRQSAASVVAKPCRPAAAPAVGWGARRAPLSVDELGGGWAKVLAGESGKQYWDRINALVLRELSSGNTIFPRREDVFACFNLCPFDSLRVVIVGQDPYHGPNQAEGLSFSVRRGVPTPPSLVNIIKEAKSCVGIQQPRHGSLVHWAKQGVLLLNSVLTVRKREAASHQNNGWEEFTDAVIRAVNTECTGVVFLLWGKPAQQKGAHISRDKHVVITSSHPSPYSADKTSQPFLGSRCFKRANDALEKRALRPVDWNLDPVAL